MQKCWRMAGRSTYVNSESCGIYSTLCVAGLGFLCYVTLKKEQHSLALLFWWMLGSPTLNSVLHWCHCHAQAWKSAPWQDQLSLSFTFVPPPWTVESHHNSKGVHISASSVSSVQWVSSSRYSPQVIVCLSFKLLFQCIFHEIWISGWKPAF